MIVFPLFHIRDCLKIITEDKIITIRTLYGDYILDNKNIRGNTLGIRRLNLSSSLQEDQRLYPLRKIFYTFSDIITHKHKHKVYIDSIGTLFKYTKSKRCNLVYKKITNIEVQATRILCTCKGLFRPIEVPYIPRVMPRYLGLLCFQGDYILYELSQCAKAETWRLV